MCRYRLLSATAGVALILGPLAAQHQADKWYFGMVGDGLDFHTDPQVAGCEPLVLSDGNMVGFEGVATVSHPLTGELLFYTNSEEVWDRTHQVMPNGGIEPPGLLTGQNTISQVLIVPKPLSEQSYYIFTNQIQGMNSPGMRVAEVDMALNGGLGDIVFSDSVVYADTVSEKVTAVPHANGTDLWVIGHDFPGSRFFAIRITSDGIQYPFVLSDIGKYYPPSTVDCIGEVKASPDGTMLAVSTYQQPDIELFHFDNATGVISDPIVIEAPAVDPLLSYWYGVSFSPDNTKLYAGRRNFGLGTPSIIQVDVSTYETDAVNATKITISTVPDVWSLQLAPNGKIYTCRSGNHLGAIHQPDAAGVACDFDPHAIDFGHQPGGFDGVWGFNNSMAVFPHPCYQTAIPTETPDRPVGLYPHPAVDHTWLVLDTPPNTPYRILIFDVHGKLVGTSNAQAHQRTARLDLSSMEQGVYLVLVEDPHSAYRAQRLVVWRE